MCVCVCVSNGKIPNIFFPLWHSVSICWKTERILSSHSYQIIYKSVILAQMEGILPLYHYNFSRLADGASII